MCRRKKLESQDATLAPFDRSWLHLSENPNVHQPKNKPLSQDMQLRILRFEQRFENVKGCREAAFRLFVKQIPPTDSWHEDDSDRCNFHPLMPALTLVSLLERYLWFESTATPRADIGKRRSRHL
jgi:hypothetical protein